MADDRVEIELVLDDGSVQKGFARVQREGKRTGRNLGKSLTAPFGSLRNQILGIGAALATAFAGRKVIAAAAVQEQAVQQLNTALKLSGEFTRESSQAFQDWASGLQSVSTIGDEVILQQAAIAKGFGLSNDEARQLVETAADLSASMGISLESAVRNLGKTYSGLIGELGESVPIIRNLTAEQLRAGGAVRILSERFGGAAQAAQRTFAGGIQTASNAFGDLLEEIGFFITRSPFVIEILNQATTLFTRAGGAVKSFLGDRDLVQDFVSEFVRIGLVINEFVIAPMELLSNVGSVVFNGIKFLIQSVTLAVANLGSGIGKLLNAVGILSDESATALSNFAESTVAVREQFGEGFSESLENLGDFDAALASQNFLLKFREFVEITREPFREANDQLNAEAQQSALQAGQFINQAWKDTFSRTALTGDSAQKELQTKLSAGFKAFRNGVASSFSTIGQALVQGENAFSAFGKTILGLFGDLAIQLGQFYFLLGIGNLFLNPSAAAQQIFAGIGLQILGGALKAAAGGGGTTPAGGGAAAGAGGEGGGVASAAGLETAASPATELAETEEAQPLTQVSVNVQGNVLDRRETGLELVEILNESFGANGTTVTSGAV